MRLNTACACARLSPQQAERRSLSSRALIAPTRPCLVLSCLIHASCWANAPRWGGRLRCWLAAPLPLPQTWTCCAVQIVTRVPLSLYLGPRLVNVVSLRKRPNSLYLQNKLSPYLDALQHLSPLPPVLRQLLPLRHLQLTQQRLHPSYLLAFHCCFLRHFC